MSPYRPLAAGEFSGPQVLLRSCTLPCESPEFLDLFPDSLGVARRILRDVSRESVAIFLPLSYNLIIR